MKLIYKLLIPITFVLLISFVGLYRISLNSIQQLMTAMRIENLRSLTRTKITNFNEDNLKINPIGATLSETLNGLKTLDPSIFRIKVWNKDLTIIYSDLDNVVGTNTDTYRDKVKDYFGKDMNQNWFSVDKPDLNSPEGKFGSLIVGMVPLRENISHGTRFVVELYSATNMALEFVPRFSLSIGLLFVGLFIFSLICDVLILFIFVIKPIRLLQKESDLIGMGNLNHEIKSNSHDEIGDLMQSFNSMRLKILEYSKGLEHLVEERTKQLQEKTVELVKEKKGIEQKIIERTQQLSDEQAKLRASINSFSMGYIMTANDNSIILINNAAKDILTLSTPTAQPAQHAIDVTEVKKSITMDFIQSTLLDHVDILARIEEVKQKRSNLLIENIQYKMLYLTIYLAPIISEKTQQILGTVILLEDVTEKKLLDRSRDEFFSIASHELRTPLTAIRGNTSMLQEHYLKTINNPEVTDIVSDIHESSVRLIEIVNDFLDLSRLEQGKIQFISEAFDVVKLCEEVVREYNVTGSRKKLYLKVTHPQIPPSLVYADKSRIRQIIVNLLGNSIKFTSVGGVEITFNQLDNSVKVLITDTGIGIPPENQMLLFRKFQQAETNIYTRDTTKGTGLGLYIAKMLIINMGGTIALEKSEVGKGTTFSITIPNATPSQLHDAERTTA